MNLSRRDFLKLSGATVGGAALAHYLHLQMLEPVNVANPLAAYPDRGWEQIYRNQYAYDSSFTYVCSPNDTHACRLRAFVRNGVILRSETNYDVGSYSDLDGRTATAHWHPRGCKKGQTFHRRVYGPHRLKGPIMRQGWKNWADDGYPYLDAANRDKYKFTSRGTDVMIPISWEEAYRYIARGMIAIATHYSGAEGATRLRADGYPDEMIAAMQGAGTRTFKCRGGMGLLGVIGKYGMYRFANTLALLDANVRGTNEETALGGRRWSNYTWHGDQAPGHPFTTGLQTSDCDFNDLRNTRLHIQCGKNLVENKMAESHFFIETMERGGKIYTITPEYSPPATKADTWIPIRPSTDTALFLGITKWIMDNERYDETFVKQFTDFPLLVRLDTLKRLHPHEIFPDYTPGLAEDGPSFALHGLSQEQYERLGDYVVFDETKGELAPLTRDDVGERMVDKRINPRLSWSGKVTLLPTEEGGEGEEIEVMTLWAMYEEHLQEYDLDTVADITHAPKQLIQEMAEDITTMGPVAIHIGEGINHWFHATLANRAQFLPLMLTGNIGKPGAGCYTWAGNYKAALFQGSPWAGPGFKGWVAEDPFHPSLDDTLDGKDVHAHSYAMDEEPAYWNHGDRPLIVDTPKYGRKNFTGATHMPTPTKVIFHTNVNLLNNAKHHYDMIKNVNPLIDLIIAVEIEMTSSVEYADFGLAANSWAEFTVPEITASCSNPFLQIWKGGIPPIYDTRDDAVILAEVAAAIGDEIGDSRFRDYWKFVLEGRPEVYIQRLLDMSVPTRGYKYEEIMAGKYGEPGAALMLFRTYPRIPFWEQVHDSEPFFTDCGRLAAYCDIPEAIEYGENIITHREGPEATPYLPNVIVTGSRFVRPDDYGIPEEEMGWDERTVRNIAKPWSQVKQTSNPLWEQGFHFYCLTPKTRHRVHSSWSTVDWTIILDSNFGDPYRVDKRLPGVGDHQLHMHPQAAKDLGIEDGDYVYVDANPADRPYRGWQADDPFYKVSRLMLRVKYNPAYPYHIIMLKHGPFMATEKSVHAHETRPDGLAKSEGTGYQANLRYGSQQSLTRDWSMPMHQTDTLFHKQKVFTAFMFGGEADNHALNTVPKETLVKVEKAEPGGLNGVGVWEPVNSGFTPGHENAFMEKYMAGNVVTVSGQE
ncbi:MAG: molybdopterin-dependent oxidoreductase [Chloroflexi bacterium]|nr:molybdopterin-dependent oxidoreductase [Ardenticatenaceae bacterium]MBL1127860.1 twin-arginine translocation signal domain-containing protein [Chloroflexota bacterium]NOG33929.1 molybdopterin-dependent oxidoreductase [Chloroflexota bacterium]GIK55612.1 MAG: molybdopterin oxidoreductase [Chloroflexota bacterium]